MNRFTYDNIDPQPTPAERKIALGRPGLRELRKIDRAEWLVRQAREARGARAEEKAQS